nr:unnamed protein product [Digitaria exilis]
MHPRRPPHPKPPAQAAAASTPREHGNPPRSSGDLRPRRQRGVTQGPEHRASSHSPPAAESGGATARRELQEAREETAGLELTANPRVARPPWLDRGGEWSGVAVSCPYRAPLETRDDDRSGRTRRPVTGGGQHGHFAPMRRGPLSPYEDSSPFPTPHGERMTAGGTHLSVCLSGSAACPLPPPRRLVTSSDDSAGRLWQRLGPSVTSRSVRSLASGAPPWDHRAPLLRDGGWRRAEPTRRDLTLLDVGRRRDGSSGARPESGGRRPPCRAVRRWPLGTGMHACLAGGARPTRRWAGDGRVTWRAWMGCWVVGCCEEPHMLGRPRYGRSDDETTGATWPDATW